VGPHAGDPACAFRRAPVPDGRALGIARARNLPVIEDAAHAAGATYRGKKAGTLGDLGCLSFYATKNMTTGEGGAILTPNPEIALRARRLSLHGMDRDAWKRLHHPGLVVLRGAGGGGKYNMTDLEAALGLVQLRRLDAMNARRAEIARRYDAAFGNHPAWKFGPMPGAEPAVTSTRCVFISRRSRWIARDSSGS
jgi:dTDP-4-amino-4,6-dideoxygalactose transaminase